MHESTSQMLDAVQTLEIHKYNEVRSMDERA